MERRAQLDRLPEAFQNLPCRQRSSRSRHIHARRRLRAAVYATMCANNRASKACVLFRQTSDQHIHLITRARSGQSRDVRWPKNLSVREASANKMEAAGTSGTSKIDLCQPPNKQARMIHEISVTGKLNDAPDVRVHGGRIFTSLLEMHSLLQAELRLKDYGSDIVNTFSNVVGQPSGYMDRAGCGSPCASRDALEAASSALDAASSGAMKAASRDAMKAPDVCVHGGGVFKSQYLKFHASAC